MKASLRHPIPWVTLLLVTGLLLTCLVIIFSDWGKALLLYPAVLNQPAEWYRLLTYPLYLDRLITWFLNALTLLLTAWVFEKRTSPKAVLGIILLSSLLGGLGYALLNQAHPQTPLASPLMIGWGYVSAALVCGVICWKSLGLFEKIILGLCVILLLRSFFPPYHHQLLLIQLLVMAAVALLSLGTRMFKKATFAP